MRALALVGAVLLAAPAAARAAQPAEPSDPIELFFAADIRHDGAGTAAPGLTTRSQWLPLFGAGAGYSPTPSVEATLEFLFPVKSPTFATSQAGGGETSLQLSDGLVMRGALDYLDNLGSGSALYFGPMLTDYRLSWSVPGTTSPLQIVDRLVPGLQAGMRMALGSRLYLAVNLNYDLANVTGWTSNTPALQLSRWSLEPSLRLQF